MQDQKRVAENKLEAISFINPNELKDLDARDALLDKFIRNLKGVLKTDSDVANLIYALNDAFGHLENIWSDAASDHTAIKYLFWLLDEPNTSRSDTHAMVVKSLVKTHIESSLIASKNIETYVNIGSIARIMADEI